MVFDFLFDFYASMIVNIKVELELRMDTACANYSRSKGEQVKS